MPNSSNFSTCKLVYYPSYFMQSFSLPFFPFILFFLFIALHVHRKMLIK
ncbi:hypothetical protein Ahy_B04g069061 isoform B [Arachis hypogaea]|uniref:Uncharacterized protein n=1 Tax=Arachis hypogaea TaxID=3818 RepID=A0A444ZBS8_ARAHY|nr:hypothetical protein Ahy_B04g069061 isoform B [Arachis hypogaea]